MKPFRLIIVLLFCGAFTNAQSWNTLVYNPDQPQLELNPLKGFADLYGPQNNFPRSINAKLFGLDEVMNGIDNFDWTVIDNFIAQNKSEGNFSYIQVNIDPGENAVTGMAETYMPAFLLPTVPFYNYPGDANNPADLCPDWNNPQLNAAMLNFIQAFGAKYNDKPEVFMVHLGLYGIYGEWHIGKVEEFKPEYEMTPANRTAIVNAYINAFPDKYLLARYPEHMPEPEVIGYSDGLFFTESISSDTFFNHFFFDNTLKAYNTENNWKNWPIGGEIAPAVQPTIWQNWPNTVGQDVTASFNAIHPSFLFTHHVFTAMQPNTAEWDNAIRAQKLMGYTFHIDKYRLSANAGIPTVEVNIENKGIAPMYGNWDVEIGVLDTNGGVQSLGVQKWNLDIIQPNEPNNYRALTSSTTLTDGSYTFLLRVVNPLEAFSSSAKPVRFANTTQDQDINGWITLGDMTITNGSSGGSYSPVTNLTLAPSTASVTVGNNLQLTTTLAPTSATNSDVTWASSKPGTLSIDHNGLATAGPAYGDVTITAYSQDGLIIGTSDVTVEPFRVIVPAIIEAEDYIRMSGIVSGFNKLGFIDNSDWMDYAITVNTTGNFYIDVTASCPSGTGELNILDENGVLLDTLPLQATNGFSDFVINTSNSIPLQAGNYIIRFEAKVGAFDLDRMEFRVDTLSEETLELTNEIILYPNPTNSTINIKTIASIDTVILYDMSGLQVLQVKNSKSLDLNHIKSGVYFAQIITKDNLMVTKRIIKN